MKERSILVTLLMLFLFYGGYQGYEYYNDHFVNQRIIQNILERKNYSLTKKDTVKIDLPIKSDWIPFETEEPQKLNFKIAESHNTNILLQEVWNRGNDIYFSFHTTFDLNYNNGKFLYNMLT